MKIKVQDIRQVASQRPEGYVEEVLASGTVAGDVLTITREEYSRLIKKYNPNFGKVPPQSERTCCGKGEGIQIIKPSPKKLPMPPITTQMGNAFKAVTRVATSAAKGVPFMATKETVDSRKAICDACEFLDKTRNRCSKCGCAYARKISLNTERCPIGKWEKATS